MDLKTADEVIKKHQAIIDEFVDLTRRRKELELQIKEIKARLIRIGGGREGPRDKANFFEGKLLVAMQALGVKNLTSDDMLIYINRAFGVSCRNGHGRAVELLEQNGYPEYVEPKANLTLLKNVTKELIAEAEASGDPIAAEDALPEELRDEFSIFEEFTLRGKDSRTQKGAE